MKRSPGPRVSLQRRTKPPTMCLVPDETGTQRVKGMSRWRALDRKQFRELIESPVTRDSRVADILYPTANARGSS
jgi:hypothetical protein